MLDYTVSVVKDKQEQFHAGMTHKLGKRIIKDTALETFDSQSKAELYQENMGTMLKAFQQLKRRGF